MSLLKPNIKKLQARQDIGKLIDALGDDDSNIRKAAADALGSLKNPRALESLIFRIVDWDESVRLAVVQALNEIDSNWRNSDAAKQAIPTLMELLEYKGQRTLVRDASLMMGLSFQFLPAPMRQELFAGQAVPALVEIIRSAIWAIGEISDPRAINTLILAVYDSDLREKAKEALGKIKRTDPVEFLKEALLGGDVFHHNTMGIVEQVFPNWQNSEAAGQVVPHLISMLRDQSQQNNIKRCQAAEALGKIGGQSAVNALTSVLMEGGMTLKAAEVLGEIRDPIAIEPLVMTLAWVHNLDTKWDSSKIKEVLTRINPNWRNSDNARKAIPNLIVQLKSEYFNIRRGSAQVLGELKHESAVEPLIEAISSEDRYLRLRAAESLGELKDERAVPALKSAIADQYEDVRDAAANALKIILGNES